MKFMERTLDKGHSPKPLAYFINGVGPSGGPGIFRTLRILGLMENPGDCMIGINRGLRRERQAIV